MNLEQNAYAVDANILISAHRDHYPPDLFPGIWDSMAHHIVAGRLLIIDRVRRGDNKSVWVGSVG